jgi:hypothetical protein
MTNKNKYEHLVTRLPSLEIAKEEANLKELSKLLSSMRIGDTIKVNHHIAYEIGLSYEQAVKFVDMSIGYGNLPLTNLDVCTHITKQRL